VARALELVIGGLSLGGIYALLAFAMSLTISTTRVLNVAHGVFFVWGGATFVILSQRLRLHPVLAIVILTGIFFVLALLFERGIVRTLLGRSQHMLLVGSIMATFGLGLSMARRALEQQGGSILFDRTEGGTRFVVGLPLARERSEQHPRATAV